MFVAVVGVSVAVVVVTQRRSVAKSFGCFQRRLFACLSVCLFVCLFVDMITSERVDIK